jgi:RNA polymerase II subunit A-like phosphatase
MDLDAEPSTPTPVHLPPTLPYPITISALHLRPSTSIAAPTKAISYTYQLKDDLTEGADVNTQVKGKKKGGERGYASWDCAVEGEVVGWGEGMNVGTVLRDAR